MKESTKGITLVALVVTIVVLLILAGITLTYVLGDNSVIDKAKSAKLAQEQGSVLEYTRMKALTKVTETENNVGYIDYLKTNHIIKSEVAGEAEKIYYIVDPLIILSDPTYGKGSFETGDVY